MSYDDNNTMNDKNSFDDEIFIALFRKGTNDYLENNLLTDLPEKKSGTESGLSEFTEKKIKKNIRQAIRREKSMRIMKRLPRIAAIVLIVIAVCAITVMSVEALRVPLLNLFVHTEEKIMDIDLEEGQANDEDTSLSDMFGYIPKEYELTSEDIQEQVASFNYMNINEDSIIIDRYVGEGKISVDTENAECGNIMINGNQAFYTIKNELTNLVISKDGYTYMIYGSINFEEIVKIAENIK